MTVILLWEHPLELRKGMCCLQGKRLTISGDILYVRIVRAALALEVHLTNAMANVACGICMRIASASR